MSDKKNIALRKAQKAKQDEFYTDISDIEKELKHYKKHFKDKVVYCNCDDPKESNFFKFFVRNFKHFGLKKLITTCYKSKESLKRAYYLECSNLDFDNLDLTTDNIKQYYLEGDGDFRSEECVNLLKQADIVITNPPFSLFREYIAQLIEYDKKFLVIGSLNAITYKDIFSLIKNNKLWLGYGNGSMSFRVPDTYTGSCEGDAGNKIAKLGNICWYTNLDIDKRNEDIILYREYTSKEYPNYDNYNAINIDKVKDIPHNYTGFMGVPITFLDKHNPAQFKLLGIMNTGEINTGIRHPNTEHGRPIVNGKEIYLRILIQKV